MLAASFIVIINTANHQNIILWTVLTFQSQSFKLKV